MPEVWQAAAIFQNEAIARETFKKLQDLIFGQDSNLSVYRFTYGEQYIGVIGEKEPDALTNATIKSLLLAGVEAQIPEEVLVRLQNRRKEVSRLGPDVRAEGHYRPGMKL